MATPLRLTARAALLIGALFSCLLPAAAVAQPDAGGEIRLQVLSQPVAHEPGDRLGIGLRITNASESTLEGFALQVRAYPRVETRSDLEASLEIDQTRVESSSFPHEEATVVLPGRSTSVKLDQRLDEPGSLSLGGDSGIYPLTITITDPARVTVLDSITTFLIYLASPVESPLKIVPIWTIAEVPARGPDGSFQPHVTNERWHLEEAVGERGWLTSMLSALGTDAGRRLRFGIVPLPRTIEELTDMADGYDRTVEGETETVRAGAPVARGAAEAVQRLQEIAQEGRSQPILSPYSFVDIPSVTDDLARLQLQLQEGEAVLDELLGAPIGRAWIFPPAGRLDGDALEDLHGLEAAASTFFSVDSLTSLLEDPAVECAPPFAGGTFTCPVLVETLGGKAHGYVFDPQLQSRVQALTADDGRVALQRVFAETAMIWAELPGDPDRVVPLVIPSALHLRPQAARLLIRTLARAPWLATLTPRGGLHQGIGAAPRTVAEELHQTPLTSDESYAGAVQGAAEALDEYARLRPPADRLQRLSRTYLASQSRAWGSDPALIARGEQHARAVIDEIQDEFGKLTMGGQDDITLTSRAGELPLVLRNDTGYEVTLDIDLAWRDLDLQIERSNVRQTFPPGASPVPIKATAKASGIFPVEVTISAPDGSELTTKLITIRSTEFNEIALAITLGALAFLVLFYLFRGFGRRGKVATT
jgi:hypothetical protein